jgi:phosphoribosylformylglycinamidine synthase
LHIHRLSGYHPVMRPGALIVRTAGTNCDRETAHAFELAGASAEAIHVNRLVENPSLLDRFALMAFPGGFSYGDDIAAGRIFANQIQNHLADALRKFIADGKPIIGICNGFQVLVKTDLLPGPIGGASGQTATLTHNDCGRFVDRWIRLKTLPSPCLWTAGLDELELPIAHGEGKFIPLNASVRQALRANRQVALAYCKPGGALAGGQEPYNPNGSTDDIAGVCDASGLVFGLMPHPERYVDPTQHPAWTRQQPLPTAGAGLRFFENAVKHARQSVGAGV